MLSYDDEIIDFLAKNNLNAVIHDNENGIAFLSNTFCFSGSKIDLCKENNFFFINDIAINAETIIESIKSNHHIIETINNTSRIHYIGDNLTNIEIIFDSQYFQQILSFFIENIPEHHYFFSMDKKWCLFIATEGYIEYGEVSN